MAGDTVTIMICATCGGENVKSDAWAVWSVPDQKWELEGEPYDFSYCDDCDGECSIEERRANQIGGHPNLKLEWPTTEDKLK